MANLLGIKYRQAVQPPPPRHFEFISCVRCPRERFEKKVAAKNSQRDRSGISRRSRFPRKVIVLVNCAYFRKVRAPARNTKRCPRVDAKGWTRGWLSGIFPEVGSGRSSYDCRTFRTYFKMLINSILCLGLPQLLVELICHPES
jgi:hypothetical protein